MRTVYGLLHFKPTLRSTIRNAVCDELCISFALISLHQCDVLTDIDECREAVERGLHVCIGICENTHGSFACSCPSGYQMAADGRTCQGKFYVFRSRYFTRVADLFRRTQIEFILLIIIASYYRYSSSKGCGYDCVCHLFQY